MVKMKCKITGWTVTVQPSLAEKGYWLVTYQPPKDKRHLTAICGGQYIHSTSEIRANYENN